MISTEMGIVGCIIRAIRDRDRRRAGKLTRDEHIAASIKHVRQTDLRIGELVAIYNPHTGHCCPGCASSEYRELDKKFDRQIDWLRRLLVKRGTASDFDLIRRIDREWWP